MAVTEQGLLAALTSVQDPHTGQDFVSTRALRNVQIHGGDVAFWMHSLSTRPDINAYGYSKSFAALLGYDVLSNGIWPKNYMLNISSGHNASAAMVEYVRALPITRGEFIAVSIGKKVKGSDHGTVDTNRAIRAAMGTTKIFPCPGACGKCTGKGHACGLPALKGITIAIAIH